MTDISVHTTAYQAEDRSWLLGPHGTEPGTTPTVTLDVSTFTKADHYPDGYIKSGIVLGKITTGGKYGPYDDEASDGRQTAAGVLFSSVKVPDMADTTKDAAGAIVIHGFVDESKLIGIDTNGKADLKHLIFL